MLKSSILWPLENNLIRKKSVNNTFGMVRNGGERAHQGWDLFANPGTPVYAIAGGSVVVPAKHKDYGLVIVHKFQHGGKDYFAAYCHLEKVFVRSGQNIQAGDIIGHAGNTGNAKDMKGDDQHLHFEIRTVQFPGKGLGGRVDPKELYGIVPLTESINDPRLMLNNFALRAWHEWNVVTNQAASLSPAVAMPGVLPGVPYTKPW